MIKQLQLRGISRSPSDRMTEDGGLDESLNIYLDTAESAPALVPEDVTNSLSLPDDLQAEKVFVHKTANYENYVYVNGNRLMLSSDVLLEVQGENINDITSVGNTLVVATNKRMHYLLYKDKKYEYMGDRVPFPYIKFWAEHAEDEYPLFISETDAERAWFTKLPDEETWNKAYETERKLTSQRDVIQPSINRMLSDLWAKIDETLKHIMTLDGLSGYVFFRYAIELYDNSLISSMPILLSAGEGYPYDTTIKVQREYHVDNQNNETTTSVMNEVRVNAKFFTPYAKIESKIEELTQWKDIISKIKFYMSIPASRSYNRSMSRMYDRTETKSGTGGSFTEQYEAKLFLGSKQDEQHPEQKLLEDSAMTFLVGELDISTTITQDTEKMKISLAGLTAGAALPVSQLTDSTIQAFGNLTGDDMKHYAVTAERLDAYNASLMAIKPSQIISYDYNHLNSYEIERTQTDEHDFERYFKYEVYYYLKGAEKENVIHAGPFQYRTSVFEGEKSEEKIYSFQIFPDARAYRMEVLITEHSDNADAPIAKKRWERFEMKKHPYMDCSYYYGAGLTDMLSLCPETQQPLYPMRLDAVDEIPNKLLVSKLENPFYFPLERTYTFQSKVHGVALATTALSQGQFGQFPLYVFTEDGIWAMETAADGSFITSKPLSRDVCVNPDSITSIDNAVVFVTDKGVMLLQGSQVVNISPFMTGRHYTINQSAKDILETSDYASLLPSLTDADTFMGFVKKAAVAYDYAGKRLVFIASDEAYQYVYKLDTQTWHKLKHEVELIEPINSYPECLVRGKEEHHFISLYIEDVESRDDRTYELFKREAKDTLNLTENQISMMWNGGNISLDLNKVSIDEVEGFIIAASQEAHVDVAYDEMENVNRTRVYDLSTILDGTREQSTELGCLITRPLDLGYADIKKVIKDIRIRGEFAKGHVQYILQGSDDGVNYFNTALKHKSWKLFRIIIVCALDRFERISWIDIDYDIRYNNRLR